MVFSPAKHSFYKHNKFKWWTVFCKIQKHICTIDLPMLPNKSYYEELQKTVENTGYIWAANNIKYCHLRSTNSSKREKQPLGVTIMNSCSSAVESCFYSTVSWSAMLLLFELWVVQSQSVLPHQALTLLMCNHLAICTFDAKSSSARQTFTVL